VKTRFSRLAAALTLAALALPAAASAAPSYYPEGPQTTVARTTPTSGGWEVCYSGDYGDFDQPMANILTACDGDYLMLAAGAAGDPNYSLLAAAPREDVTFDLGEQTSATHIANGSGWYFSANYSWGFVKAGDTVSRTSCDTDESGSNDLRLCWHTWSNSLQFGYRAGADQGLNNGSYDRVILQAYSSRAVGSPDPLDFGDQAPSTVSDRETVSYTVTAPVGATDAERTLGELDTTGPNATEFDVVSENCPEMAPADGTPITCEARLRFVPQGLGARTATLKFANALGTVTLQGNGVALPPAPAGADGADGTDGTNGADGTNGVDGTNGADGTNGVDGTNGADGTNGKNGVDGKDGATGPAGSKGDKGDKGRSVKRRKLAPVGCKVAGYRAGSRMVCKFTKRVSRNVLVQLRDRAGALSTAEGNGRKTMIFVSRRPAGKRVRAFTLRGVPVSVAR
jgi:hypothetical protein